MVHLKPQFGKECFIALGGNFEATLPALCHAILTIASLKEVFNVEVSRLYRTTPVSSIPQPDFLNACLKLTTTLTPLDLFSKLEEIERRAGKTAKSKEASRLIDLDLLFYGNEVLKCEKLILPHPRWKERLFVLVPLNDLLDVSKILKNFENHYGEVVRPFPYRLPFARHT